MDRSPARARRVGVVVLATLGPLAVVAAAALRRVVDAAVPRPGWWSWEPWLPSPLPQAIGSAEPWPVLLPVLALATMALAAAGLAALLLARGAAWPRIARFLGGWVVTGLAALAMVVVVQFGAWQASVALFGGRGGYHLRGETLPALWQVLVWTALWGWLPALLAALLGGPRATETPHAGRWRVLGAALLAAALAVGWGASEVARRAASWTGPVPSVPTVAPAPTDPPATANPTAQPAFAGRCDPGDLTFGYRFTDASLGARLAEVTVRNDGTAACSLTGLPDLAFADAGGNSLAPRLVEDGRAAAADVTVSPGGQARAELSWRAGVAAGEPATATIWVAAWPGATRTAVPAEADIGDGTEVNVGPWQPT
jgi:hypothetical protein